MSAGLLSIPSFTRPPPYWHTDLRMHTHIIWSLSVFSLVVNGSWLGASSHNPSDGYPQGLEEKREVESSSQSMRQPLEFDGSAEGSHLDTSASHCRLLSLPQAHVSFTLRAWTPTFQQSSVVHDVLWQNTQCTRLQKTGVIHWLWNLYVIQMYM